MRSRTQGPGRTRPWRISPASCRRPGGSWPPPGPPLASLCCRPREALSAAAETRDQSEGVEKRRASAGFTGSPDGEPVNPAEARSDRRPPWGRPDPLGGKNWTAGLDFSSHRRRNRTAEKVPDPFDPPNGLLTTTYGACLQRLTFYQPPSWYLTPTPLPLFQLLPKFIDELKRYIIWIGFASSKQEPLLSCRDMHDSDECSSPVWRLNCGGPPNLNTKIARYLVVFHRCLSR